MPMSRARRVPGADHAEQKAFLYAVTRELVAAMDAENWARIQEIARDFEEDDEEDDELDVTEEELDIAMGLLEREGDADE